MKTINAICQSLLLSLLMLTMTGCNTIRNHAAIRSAYYPPEVKNANPLGDDTEGKAMDHLAYASILQQFVDEQGQVDYQRMAESPKRLQYYTYELGGIELSEYSRYEQLAILLNAYNAFTLQLILEHPNAESITDIPEAARWDDRRWKVGGLEVSLKELEHEIIRLEYMDPRIHFALVCAAKGCPRLRNEPYAGAKLAEQLDDQARHFFRQPDHFQWNPFKRVVKMSELLDWYRSDFGADEKELLRSILPYLIPGEAKEIETRFDDVRIQYMKYDWDLNGNR